MPTAIQMYGKGYFWWLNLPPRLFTNTVFSPRKIQGMMGELGLGVVSGHIEAFGLFPFPHQRKISAEGLQGRHALSMLGRILQHNDVAVSLSVA